MVCRYTWFVCSGYFTLTLKNTQCKIESAYCWQTLQNKSKEHNPKHPNPRFVVWSIYIYFYIYCIFVLHSIIAETLSCNKKLYCEFVDFEKCFDKINRGYLFHKLLNSNISTKFVNVVKSMYSTVNACVRHNSTYSPFFDSNIRVKQGDQCSSLLFLY